MRFHESLAGGEKRARVQADLEYGRAMGVRGTPTLLLDGRNIGWNGYPDLLDQVNRQVNRHSTRTEDKAAPLGQR